MTSVRQLSQRFSIWVAGLSLLALATVLRNQPSTYIGDNRFEQYWNPGRRITRTFTIWDGSRGLGWVREEFWPGATIPIGLFRLLGASPALAEHLWHATLLAAAASGCVALLRCYRPVLGWEHLVAALVYVFGPFSATFLLPSNLYFHHALTPWLLVVVYRGLHSRARWRTASAFALVVFLAGNLDTPGLIFAGVPMALLVVHEVWIERRIGLRWALGWFGRAGLLTSAVSAAAVAKSVIGADALTQRLESTETPAVVALASSWSESWRGLGFWVSYLREGGHPIRSTGAPYMTGIASVMLTFAPAILAVGAIWWARRDRARLLFAAMAVAGVFLMVGAHPAEHPPPWGRGWLWTLNGFPSASVVRATYKAGITATLGVAVLVGIGVSALAGRARTVVGRRLVVAGLVVVLVSGATPFWRGELYEPTNQMRAVAGHWSDAMAWLDHQQGTGQALIVPGATRAAYYWGWAGDDIQDALMKRGHLTSSAITVSP
ncbi:MAG: alpha-(1-_3)-arabinofuranosyltransferase family protein, partial [Acidimicrobiales bacterium]